MANDMTGITVSKFNKKHVWTTTALTAIGVLSTSMGSLFKSFSWSIVAILGAIMLVVLVIWLCFLKTITVFRDGLEVRRTMLPFIRRFYRYEEFDYSQIDYIRGNQVFRLISDGKRIVNIPANLYANYGTLIRAIPVKGIENFYVRDNAEVVSIFGKPLLWSITGACTLFILIGCGGVISSLLNGESFGKTAAMAVFVLLFTLLLTVFLSDYAFISIWNKQITVRPLIWPFIIRYYKFDELSGAYKVLVKSNGQSGSTDEEALWIVKDGRLIVPISQKAYKNYEELRNAIPITCLGCLELTVRKSLRYLLFRKIKSNEP